VSAAEVAPFDIPFEGIEIKITEWVSEALDLRYAAAGDPEGPLRAPELTDTPEDIRLALIRSRLRADRVEELMAKITQARSRVKLARDQAKFAADQAYDEATRKNQTTRRAEFVTAREKHADASLDSIEQRRIAHQAARLVEVADMAHEVVNRVHWSFEGIRKDLRSTLHALQFESSLER
jgi:hypothetical protein